MTRRLGSIRDFSHRWRAASPRRISFFVTLLVAAMLVFAPRPATAIEEILFRTGQRTQSITGRVVPTSIDGVLLIEGRDGSLWNVTHDELVKRSTNDEPFEPFGPQELSTELKASLPEGFDVHRTAHYPVCHDTSRAYAQWCGGLFERLYKAFNNYWTKRGFKLETPKYPLVAVVFADRQKYLQHARDEVGSAIENVIGYYSLRTNRITTFDLSGMESLRGQGNRRGSVAEINQMLDSPQAEQAVSTIIHEATHQIAFNCGFQVRYADVPLWVSEGIAVYFETPDLKSQRGWRNIGAVNYKRLERFREFQSRRARNSLQTLLADDQRFRDNEQAYDAYAEAWALNYFLIQQRSEQYHDYLQRLARKPLLDFSEPATRLAEFQDAFGEELPRLDVDFLRYMGKVK